MAERSLLTTRVTFAHQTFAHQTKGERRNPKHQAQTLDSYPNVKRWFNSIHTRPAVQRAHQAVDAAGEAYLALKKAG